MKVFLSYRHSGGDEEANRKMLSAAYGALSEENVESTSILFDVKIPAGTPRPAPHKMMVEAFRMIDKSDALLVVQRSDERSEGMLMEVGYCLAKGIPVAVATSTAVKKTYLPTMAKWTMSWADYDDLAHVVKKWANQVQLSEENALV